jgi:urease accessory protein
MDQLSTTTDASALLYLLQSATSFFPTGAFAHSYGFEALIEDRTITDADSLREQALLWLRHSVAPVDGAVCAMAWAAARDGRDSDLSEFDDLLNALRITRETREASLSTGRAFIRAAVDAFGAERLVRYDGTVKDGVCLGHYATAFGIAGFDAHIDQSTTVAALLHGGFSSLVGVCARIIPLGQIAVQRIVADARGEILSCTQRALLTGTDDLGTSAALLDIASMAHERIYTRLCIS